MRALYALTLRPELGIAAGRRELLTLASLRALSAFSAARLQVRSLRGVALPPPPPPPPPYPHPYPYPYP